MCKNEVQKIEKVKWVVQNKDNMNNRQGERVSSSRTGAGECIIGKASSLEDGNYSQQGLLIESR